MLHYIYIVLLGLAIFQIVSFLLRLISKKRTRNTYRKRMRIYGVLVLVYLILLLLASVLEMNNIVKWNNMFIVIYIFIIPSLLALYYWNTMYRNYSKEV